MTTTCDTVQVCGQNTECCNQTISVGGEKTETHGQHFSPAAALMFFEY